MHSLEVSAFDVYRSSNFSFTSRRALRRRPASRNTSLLIKLFSKLISTVYLRGACQFVRATDADLPSGHQVIVVDHFDEGFNLVSASLFLLSHSFRHLAWITADTSDHGMTIASFIATFVVWLECDEQGNWTSRLDRLDAYFDHNSLAACIAAGQDYHDFLTLHNFHHGWDEKEI